MTTQTTMRTGITTRDVEFYSPGANARGTIKAGVLVKRVKKGDWSAWVVAHHRDAEFMSAFDWKHRFVDVPADAVQEDANA